MHGTGFAPSSAALLNYAVTKRPVLHAFLQSLQNNKDYFDQSLDEIKLLKYVNSMDPNDEYAIVRLYDFFYYKVRVCTRVHFVGPEVRERL